MALAAVLFSMEAGRDLFSRHAERMTAEALADTRVVVVNGARQVGKSTLAELIVARSAGARELYLDPVFAHGISLREPAGPADVDFEEVE